MDTVENEVVAETVEAAEVVEEAVEAAAEAEVAAPEEEAAPAADGENKAPAEKKHAPGNHDVSSVLRDGEESDLLGASPHRPFLSLLALLS